MIPYLIETFIFLMGLCIGSFLNVCIYRLPASQSIVHPRSMCPQCGTLIAFYDNFPIFSYLWLQGKCRRCQVKIPMRYPMVELLGGLFALGTYLRFGLGIETLIYYFWQYHFVFLAKHAKIERNTEQSQRIMHDTVSNRNFHFSIESLYWKFFKCLYLPVAGL